MLESTIKLYNNLSTKLLPVPSRPHYLFNMRHINRIFQSILGIPKVRRGDYLPKELVLLWAHESTRVLADGLLDEQEATWFQKQIYDLSMNMKGPHPDTVRRLSNI